MWDGPDEMGFDSAGEAMRSVAMQYNATPCHATPWDWMEFDGMGSDAMRSDAMGLDFFNDGWGGIGDSYSWITNIQWLLLMFRVVSMVKKKIESHLFVLDCGRMLRKI